MIGLAMKQYSLASNNMVIPCVVWNDGVLTFHAYGTYPQIVNTDTNSAPDYWMDLLIQGHYLPDPGIPLNGSYTSSTAKTVLVCPAARDALYGTNLANIPPGALSQTTSDGFDRRQSAFIAMKGSPIPHGIVVDVGYGINSYVQPDTTSQYSQSPVDLVSTAISYDGSLSSFPIIHKLNQFRLASQTVIVFDGAEWNIQNYTNRISGGSHGKFNPSQPYDTGTCNLLFLDWHAESAPRVQLPTPNPGPNGASSIQQLCGPLIYSRGPRYRWSLDQQD
jgi:prepilin-type processing-associated H-X9-DG protein